MNRMQRRKELMQRKKFEPKTFIAQSNAIEGIFSDSEIEQSLKAWDYLKGIKELKHKDIRTVQQIITYNQQDLDPKAKGAYRSVTGTNVSIGGRRAPVPALVDQLMQEWLDKLNKMTPLIAHIRFEVTHPFVDGNGRTGRMLYWWHCKQLNETPYLHTEKRRDLYYKLFDKTRVEKLLANNWGIDFQKIGWEAIIKTTDGETLRAAFFDKPTDKEIRASLPKSKKLAQVIKVSKVED